MPGGAGNVVRNLTALGAAVAFISVVGDDQAGADLTGLIGGQPNIEPWLLVQGGRITTLKTRYLSAGQQLLRADREETLADPAAAGGAPDAHRARCDGGDLGHRAIGLQKGLLSRRASPAQLIAAAREAGRPVIVDPRGADYARYAGADIIMPNRTDLAAAAGMPVDTEAAVVAAATALRQRHGFGAVLVTRGNDGMSLLDAAGARHFPAEAAEVYDIAGAGDTAVATLAAGLARAAGAAGRGAAGQHRGRHRGREDRHRGRARGRPARGAVPAGRRTAEDRLARGGGRERAALAPQGLARRLHPRLLRPAAPRTFSCWRRPARPAIGWSSAWTSPASRPRRRQSRAAMLASLASVDLVTVFDEESPAALIEALHPDMVVKNAG